MREFDVGLCVCDAMPNHNESHEFARAFPGRVYLSYYTDGGKDMVKWADKVKMKESIRKGSPDIKLKWQVDLHRYMTLDQALRCWNERDVSMPHPDGCTQIMKNEETGRYEVQSPARLLWTHLTSLVREIEAVGDEDEGKTKMKYIYVNRDPHFAHAWNYCNVALGRLKKQSFFAM
jgi:hypothetical protein